MFFLLFFEGTHILGTTSALILVDPLSYKSKKLKGKYNIKYDIYICLKYSLWVS